MDVYSNILYVQEAFGPLSHLAHRLASSDKYRPETCCVIGNYYSLKAGVGRVWGLCVCGVWGSEEGSGRGPSLSQPLPPRPH